MASVFGLGYNARNLAPDAQPRSAPRGPSAPGAPRAWLLPFLVALAPLAWLIWRFDFLVDDAFISFRYARNLALGHGLVFNVGESPPVEGYTNFLWVLMLAAVETLGWDPALWSRALSSSAPSSPPFTRGRGASGSFSGSGKRRTPTAATCCRGT